jgi:hypothetical protein
VLLVLVPRGRSVRLQRTHDRVGAGDASVVYVKGPYLWHAVRVINGGILTVCGRRLPLGSPIRDTFAWVFMCRTCRKGMV